MTPKTNRNHSLAALSCISFMVCLLCVALVTRQTTATALEPSLEVKDVVLEEIDEEPEFKVEDIADLAELSMQDVLDRMVKLTEVPSGDGAAHGHDLEHFDATLRKSRSVYGADSVIFRLLSDDDMRTYRELGILWTYMREAAGSAVKDEELLVEAASLMWYADKYNIPLGLAVGVAQTESSFNPRAVSHAGALGPMQVMYNIHYGLLGANGITKREDMFDPELGVAAGCLILSRYLRAEISVPGGLRRYYGVLSRNYVGTVYSYWHSFELFASGLADSWRSVLAKERSYWSKLVAGGGDVVRASSSSKPASSGSSSSRGSSGPSAPAAASSAPRSTTVFSSVNTIVIQNADGSTKVWNDQ